MLLPSKVKYRKVQRGRPHGIASRKTYLSSKGPEAHMGGGKGPVDHYVANTTAGTIMFEVDGVPLEVAKKALKMAAYKLPVKSRFLVKGE